MTYDIDIQDMLYEIDESGLDLTPWEVNFVSELINDLACGKIVVEDLTRDQREKVQEIYNARLVQ